MCFKGMDPNFHCENSEVTPLCLASELKAKPTRLLINVVDGGTCVGEAIVAKMFRSRSYGVSSGVKLSQVCGELRGDSDFFDLSSRYANGSTASLLRAHEVF